MRFASLDVYPKTLNEFRQKTTSGAIVSITCVVGWGCCGANSSTGRARSCPSENCPHHQHSPPGAPAGVRP
eukprot:scaffold676_cov115-Isochrysis_galbana.AAC.19